MVEPEKPLKKKDQIALDKEVARNHKAQLQAELEEEERLARQKEEEATIALIESWDNTQAMIEADKLLTERLQTREQEELTDEEKARLVNMFVDMDTKMKEGSNKAKTDTAQESSSKRASDELEQEKAKKQKGDDDQEEEEMKKYMEIVQDNEVEIDAIPLAIKPLMIIEYKIDKEGKMGYFKLISVNGSSKRYSSMIQMLQGIDREDLETLWKLVKAKHGLRRPKEDYERVLWGYLKAMFKPDVESEVWRNLQGYNVTVWMLFSSNGVHFVRFDNMHIFMLLQLLSDYYCWKDYADRDEIKDLSEKR
ncbi:hypothetical protein Tco_1317429 [Tanacetum coccineum]